MADAAPSYADRAAQLIADLSHTMQTSSPISAGTLAEMKDLLDLGAHALASVTADEAVLAQIEQIAHPAST